ncbi:helix-turn-helix transcriptional regulator [Plantactinospora sp. KLBMP9567]|uniref:helix-turn-helix transcriptional regulator n=1 Tax=Plantactinospora sp. KLBMP9567 TaxID=3085900 RepID=UPI0029814250|nr:LuxR C-terminal-related transcriptional regulator [Plantactinospora sp. KLBMP9567]MDW5328308.1 LuxR C-terminal-related transcriptional regulator [Plantactinospora sp. KLBMP9567]
MAVVPRLTRWGVTPDADLGYRALSMLGPRTVARLARELGMPQSRVSQALDELVAAAAVRPVPKATDTGHRSPDTLVWEAVAVERVLDTLRQRRAPVPALDRWRRHVTTATEVGLAALARASVRRWPTRAAARQRAAGLIAAERHEHLAINTEEVFDAEATTAALPLDRSILARGIRLRVLGLPPSDGDRYSAYATALGHAGGMYRELSALPLKVMIFDRRAAMVPSDPVDLEKGYIEVADPEVVQTLAGMFDRLWNDGTDPREQGVPPIELSNREQALVRLLAMGYTDQSAAQELRLSVRTVAYTMRNLMDRLGVENRFQLALLLGAAGAAPRPPRYGTPGSTTT